MRYAHGSLSLLWLYSQLLLDSCDCFINIVHYYYIAVILRISPLLVEQRTLANITRTCPSKTCVYLIIKCLYTFMCLVNFAAKIRVLKSHVARAQRAPMSFQTFIPHRPAQVMCTLQWSLSGYQHVCTSNFEEAIEGQLKKTSNERHSLLYRIFVLQTTF